MTRVAELLDTTQPSISKILARLRDHFGDPLVIRNGHAMQLTPRAVEMTEPLRKLLIASDGLCAATPAFDPCTSERAFKLLVTDVGTIVFLPPLLSRVANEGGGLTLRAVPLDSRHFEAKLESGEADLALGAFPGAPRGLRRHKPQSEILSVSKVSSVQHISTCNPSPGTWARGRTPITSTSLATQTIVAFLLDCYDLRRPLPNY